MRRDQPEIAAETPAESPDAAGAIARDSDRLIELEATTVPARIRPGSATRVHITMRPDARRQAFWNNEVEPLRVWFDVPEGWTVASPLLVAPVGTRPETNEIRRLDVELRAPETASGPVTLSGYALYHVCEQAGGACLYRRQDFATKVKVAR